MEYKSQFLKENVYTIVGILVAVVLAVILTYGMLGSSSKSEPASASESVVYTSSGESLYQNPKTGYCLFAEDDAGLLKPEDIEPLVKEMVAVTEHCNVLYISTMQNPDSTEYFARKNAESHFRNGITFAIDMDNHYIYLDAIGPARRTISYGDANDITDNVYKHASNGNYGTCVLETFKQTNTLFDGSRIERPMKYICTAIISLFLSLIIAYAWAYISSVPKKATKRMLLDNLYHYSKISDVFGKLSATVRIYKPRNKSTGGHGGHGGGFGGGGHSGGGHSF